MNFNLVWCGKKGNNVWSGMWVAIRKHKNNVVFNNGVLDDIEIFVLAQLKAWSWAKFRPKGVNYSLSDWCLCPA